jgi:hypothetical protein
VPWHKAGLSTPSVSGDVVQSPFSGHDSESNLAKLPDREDRPYVHMANAGHAFGRGGRTGRPCLRDHATIVIKDELVWRILSEREPCARLTSSQHNLTSICLRSLVLRLVVQAISPTAQFFGELP